MKKSTVRDVKLSGGSGYVLRPYHAERGTFILERQNGGPVYTDEHSGARMAGLSKRAARHLAKTLPSLQVQS